MEISKHMTGEVYKKTLSVNPWSPPGVSIMASCRMWPSTRGKGTVVAVLDTGIDYNHPDLKENVVDGRSFVFTEKDYMDYNGHGTHVAGSIAANGKILGVAPETKLLAVKVLNKDGYGSYQGIVNGLEWVRNWYGSNGEKVNVVNLSLGGPTSQSYLHKEIIKTYQAGITMVCAAGNAGDKNPNTPEISYPAYYPETLAVGAINLQTGIADFSNSNDRIDIVSPGVDTYSSYPGGKYVKLSGTSMAAPHISGAVALLYSRYLKRFYSFPDPENIRMLLHYLSIDLGEVGYDQLYGFGMFSFNLDGGKDIKLSISSKKYYVNDKSYEFDSLIVNLGGVDYAPAQELSRLLSCNSNHIPADEENPEGQVEIWS